MIGEEFFSHVLAISVTAGSSAEQTLRSPGFDVMVDQISVDVYHGGDLVLDASAKDKLTLQIEDVANTNRVFASNAISVWALNRLGVGNNFKGFTMDGSSHLKFTVAHDNTGGNFTSNLEVHIILSGHKIQR